MFFSYPGNVRNRQVSYLNGTTAAIYTYHPDNLRKTKTVNGATTNFVWANGNLVHEYTNTSTKTYFYAIILVSDSAGQAYLFNTHGDVVKLIGTLTWNYQYDAYGVQKNPDPIDTNAFRYAGQYFDTESGTYYLRARYYNPATGRFTQQDAWTNANRGDPLGLNLYCYCLGNPVRYFDPSGRTAKDVVAGVVFALDDNVLDSTSRWLLSTVLGISDRYSWDDASDYYLGRVIGDVISMAIGIGSSAAGIIEIIKAILDGAAITVSTGGVGAVVGVSVAVGEIAVGVALVAEGETATEAALYSLLDDYGKYCGANSNRLFSELSIDGRKLQHEFKHAKDFGIEGDWSRGNAALFEERIRECVENPTNIYLSKYRGEDIYVFYNSNFGIGVYTDLDGNFIGGWKLSKQQYMFHSAKGIIIK